MTRKAYVKKALTLPKEYWSNKRYRVTRFREKIKSGDILPVRPLSRFEAAIAYEL